MIKTIIAIYQLFDAKVRSLSGKYKIDNVDNLKKFFNSAFDNFCSYCPKKCVCYCKSDYPMERHSEGFAQRISVRIRGEK